MSSLKEVLIMKKIKKTIKKIIKPFQKVSYINNYIYKDNLLSGRTALITGGSGGIGFSIARTFLENGCNIIITGRNQEKLEVAVKKLKSIANKKQKVWGYKFDISETASIQKNFEKITKDCIKPIDILVNNAGVVKGKAIGDTKIADYEECLKTNLEGTYFLSQTFFNYIKSKKIKANILNVCSSSSVRPAVNPYSLGKWGEKGLTIGMAKKMIEYDIVVNGIAPGPTYTPMLVGDSTNEKDLKLNSNPSGRYTTPEEIANGALFLVSDMGRMVVGDILYMTGGAGIITVDDISY